MLFFPWRKGKDGGKEEIWRSLTMQIFRVLMLRILKYCLFELPFWIARYTVLRPEGYYGYLLCVKQIIKLHPVNAVNYSFQLYKLISSLHLFWKPWKYLAFPCLLPSLLFNSIKIVESFILFYSPVFTLSIRGFQEVLDSWKKWDFFFLVQEIYFPLFKILK